ncbi:MAG: DUF6771 family protein [Pseudomonadota bacterium]
MHRIDKTTIAQALLNAPGWARVGISDPKPWLREDAAEELAFTILHGIDLPDPQDARQSDMPL